MVERDNKKVSVIRQCQLLKINRSHLYYTPKNDNDKDEVILKEIKEIHKKFPHYGSRKIKIILSELGQACNRKTV